MKKVYWEIRKYDYTQDDVETIFEGTKATAIKKFIKLPVSKDIDYVLNKWVADMYWNGIYWDSDGYEIDEQYEQDNYIYENGSIYLKEFQKTL